MSTHLHGIFESVSMPLVLGPLLLVMTLTLLGCGSTARLPVETGYGPNPTLPEPNPPLIPTINVAPATGWPENRKPRATRGTEVLAFAKGLNHPRWLYILPNGDVLVAETNAPASPGKADASLVADIKSWMMNRVLEEAGAAVPSANRITLLRDSIGDGVADQRFAFLENLNSPFGMVLVQDSLYVANTDEVRRFDYSEGQTRIEQDGEKLVDLPAGPINYHWTKSLVASPDESKLYVGVGSNSNIAENGMEQEQGRAAIWEVDRKTGDHRVFAEGLRNPVGMAWVPREEALWVTVNERDELGGDLVPDFMTAVEDGGFYGWPYSYFGGHVDERVEPQDLERVEQAIKPDYALGAHTASLGLAYTDNRDSLRSFGRGMFVGQHGSWNRDPRSGYKVIFVPFINGRPAGLPSDVLTGFVNEDDEAMGRPTGVAIDKQGDLLVADDVGNTIWRVRGNGSPQGPRSNRSVKRVADHQ